MKLTTLEELKTVNKIIYYVRNKIDGKGYIGQTIRTFHKRYGLIWHKAHRGNYFSKALLKHGQENFEVYFLAQNIQDRKELNRLEKYYIKFYNTTDSKYGYNMREGGDRYFLYSQQLLEKLAEKRRNKNVEYPYRLLDKNGKEHIFKILSQFAQKNNLNRGNLTEVILSKRKHTKGFHLPKTNLNIRARNSINCKIRNKNGDIFEILNLKEFCLKHNFPLRRMKDMIYGTRKECNGFTLIQGSYFSERKNIPKFKYKKIILIKNDILIEVKDLKIFCEENNLYLSNFIHIIKGRGKSYKGYTIKKIIHTKQYKNYCKENNRKL